jgi:hypothetical protein
MEVCHWLRVVVMRRASPEIRFVRAFLILAGVFGFVFAVCAWRRKIDRSWVLWKKRMCSVSSLARNGVAHGGWGAAVEASRRLRVAVTQQEFPEIRFVRQFLISAAVFDSDYAVSGWRKRIYRSWVLWKKRMCSASSLAGNGVARDGWGGAMATREERVGGGSVGLFA